ncbi:hypothetical protein WR25_18268 [Diploscapter pachys]|uniref:Uncharacterized protein n=1 Tax=Diploscapter pachys TaxID=2018661 RepID=A0A2A2LMD0_9BILA|nr:hypothetical protein WR25_18268 [Diploscapter pachys]
MEWDGLDWNEVGRKGKEKRWQTRQKGEKPVKRGEESKWQEAEAGGLKTGKRQKTHIGRRLLQTEHNEEMIHRFWKFQNIESRRYKSPQI